MSPIPQKDIEAIYNEFAVKNKGNLKEEEEKRRLNKILDVKKLKKDILNLIALVEMAKVAKLTCGDILTDLSQLRKILKLKEFESLTAIYVKLRELCNTILQQPKSREDDKERLLFCLDKLYKNIKKIETKI